MEKELTAGWGWSPASPKKYHYFPANNSMSLCGRIGFFFGEREEGKNDHPENCKPCMKKLAGTPASKQSNG